MTQHAKMSHCAEPHARGGSPVGAPGKFLTIDEELNDSLDSIALDFDYLSVGWRSRMVRSCSLGSHCDQVRCTAALDALARVRAHSILENGPTSRWCLRFAVGSQVSEAHAAHSVLVRSAWAQ